MKKLALAAALGSACLALTACGDGDTDVANATNEAAAGEAESAQSGAGTAGTTGPGTSFPTGSRIVVEDDVTYRIDPDGSRIRLLPGDSRIVVEDGVRYRIDPDGTRVRIDPRGAEIEVDLPDVDLDVNQKGNVDVDVRDRDPRGR